MKENNLPLTADLVIFSVSAKDKTNYRKLTEKSMSVLLVKDDTIKNMWSLPSGFVRINESIDEAANRVLVNETNLHDIYIEQLYTFGSTDRYPGKRVISTSYVALVDKNKLEDELLENACWFDITFTESAKRIDIILMNDFDTITFEIKKNLRENTTDRYTYEYSQNSSLAYDHPLIIAAGISRIKNKLEYTDIVFNMMEEEFTLGELQQVYEVILGKKLLDPAFRRVIASKVEKTGRYKTGGGHRPSALFKFKSKR